jgi:hypothetical protein
MSARKKLNAMHGTVAVLVAAYVGLVANSWVWFGAVGFGLAVAGPHEAPGRKHRSDVTLR